MRSKRTRFIGEACLLSQNSGKSFPCQSVSQAAYLCLCIALRRFTAMQDHRMKAARTQEGGYTLSREPQRVSLIVLPKQHSTIVLVVLTVPNIVNDMRFEAVEETLHPFRRH